MCRHGAKQAERACTSVRGCWERAYGRKATADKGVRGPQGQSVRLAAAATRSLAPQVGATAPPADRSPQRPTWRPVGSLPRASLCSASAELGCPPQLPRPALARPSSLPPPGSRWTRPPPAAAGSNARACELRA